MIIKNGLVFEESGHFTKRDIYVDASHKIAACPAANDSEIIDARELYVLPGLVDVHVHGAAGYDFCDGSPEGLKQIASYFKANGITSFCPTSMSLPIEDLTHIFASATTLPTGKEYAGIAGIHMEGPFISVGKRGAQKEKHICLPDVDTFRRLNEACNGQIRLITIAPEIPCAMDFIEQLKDTVVISLGHSEADYASANRAFEAGAGHVTHLFNGMMPLHHRDSGIIGAAADHPNVMVELICDGIHIHPSVVRIVFDIFGADRVVLISDAIRATGMEDGIYELGGQEVTKKGNTATLKDGTLAGSATNLFDCMKKAVSFGIPLETAIRAATLNPAKSIHAEHIGSLAVGKEADILLVDRELNLLQVI